MFFNLLVSLGHHNKRLNSLKTEIYFLTTVKARHPRSRFQQSLVSNEGPLPDFPMAAFFTGFTHGLSSVHAWRDRDLLFLFLQGHQSYEIKGPPLRPHLTSSTSLEDF